MGFIRNIIRECTIIYLENEKWGVLGSEFKTGKGTLKYEK